MRRTTVHAASREFFRQLPWWLAGMTFTVLGILATAAWRDADVQRRDAEGALRQLAAETASQAAARLVFTAAKLGQPRISQIRPPGAPPSFEEPAAGVMVEPRWFSQPGGGEGADWVFGPWPQPESSDSKVFEEAQALFKAGKTDAAARLLEAGFLETAPRRQPAAPPATNNSGPANPAISSPNGSGFFTASGLPLPPMIRHLQLLILQAAAHASQGKNEDQGNDGGNDEARAVAGHLLEAALDYPSVLSGSLVEEAAGVLEKEADPAERFRISGARKKVAALEALRLVLRQEREAVNGGARWIGGNAWHLERRNDGGGGIVVLAREELEDIAWTAGIGESMPRNHREKPLSASTRRREPRVSLSSGLPADWSLRALLDGVDVQGFPVIPENVMASSSSGPWRLDAVCRNPATAFAALDGQLARQRWLIGGTVGFLTAALAGFLWVLQRQRRLNAMMSNFVAAVSHELRAPVASVGLLAERLNAGKVADGAEQSRYHGLIEGECRRISATIENVLAFSRMERQGPGREFELSDVRALVEDAAGVFRPQAAGRRIVLETHLPDEAVELELDPVSLRQAVINLLDNALKFSPPGGTVRLRLQTEVGARGEPEAISIIVSDEGPGVPAAESGRIFDAFYRPGSELRRGTAGIGLGLAIVRETARAHGGEVRVRNLPGSGAEFTLRLVNRASLPDGDTVN